MLEMKFDKDEPCAVEWIDCYSRPGWASDKDFKDEECFSLGYFLEEDKTYFRMYQSRCTSGYYGEILSIPQSVITRKRRLK